MENIITSVTNNFLKITALTNVWIYCLKNISQEHIDYLTNETLSSVTNVTFFFNCTNNQKYSYVTKMSVSQVT